MLLHTNRLYESAQERLLCNNNNNNSNLSCPYLAYNKLESVMSIIFMLVKFCDCSSDHDADDDIAGHAS